MRIQDNTQENMKKISAKDAFEKIVVNAGVGKASQQPQFEEKTLPKILDDMKTLSGQTPHVCRAKQSIAGFKLREGQIVGLRVTLRGKKKVDFFERFITMVLPRVHDFRGIPIEKIDEGGSLHVGLREQFVFPEINPEESIFPFSLGVTIVPKTRKTKEEAVLLYRALGVPLRK